MRVGVDQQAFTFTLGQAGGEVHRGRGLTGATLLIQDRDPPRASGVKALGAEVSRAAFQRAVVVAFTVRGDRDLEHESRPKYLPACAARLLHDLIEAASSEPGQLFGGIVGAVEPIARQALATGGDPAALARALTDRLAGPGLKLAFVFADHRLAPSAFAEIARALAVPVVGGAAAGVLGPNALGAGAGAGTL
ncbi:MAG TPA: hypothetical protein VFP84_37760, partial [Kofleriaceae bacterium]|nr:hypothetical protein [Kofleriaceae bacterium]